jgi:hypothetical protein
MACLLLCCLLQRKCWSLIGTGGDMMTSKADKTDPYADKADKQISKAEALMKNNSEIYVVKKMIATLRLLGDPNEPLHDLWAEAQAMLDEAKKLNAENPVFIF